MSGTPAPAGHSSPRRLLRPCRKGLPLPRAMRGQRDLVTGAPGALPGSAWQPDRRTEERAARHRYRGGICVPLLLRSCREPAPPGAQRAFCPVCSRARRPDAGRASLFPGPANAAGGMGAERDRWFPMRPPLWGGCFTPRQTRANGLKTGTKRGFLYKPLAGILEKSKYTY